MRSLFIFAVKLRLLLSSLLLVSCKLEPPQQAEEPGHPTPEPTPELLTAEAFTGTWETRDGTGRLFNLVLLEDGRAISNWPDTDSGAAGERALWRVADREAVIFTTAGWTSRLHPAEEGFLYLGYPEGGNLGGIPINQNPARRLDGPASEFIGVWRLNEEPQLGWLYVSIFSDGTAVSSIETNGEGRWELTDDGIRIRWADGWTDAIVRVEEGYRKRSWPPGADLTVDKPADAGPALNVANTPWRIAP